MPIKAFWPKLVYIGSKNSISEQANDYHEHCVVLILRSRLCFTNMFHSICDAVLCQFISS